VDSAGEEGKLISLCQRPLGSDFWSEIRSKGGKNGQTRRKRKGGGGNEAILLLKKKAYVYQSDKKQTALTSLEERGTSATKKKERRNGNFVRGVSLSFTCLFSGRRPRLHFTKELTRKKRREEFSLPSTVGSKGNHLIVLYAERQNRGVFHLQLRE